MKKIIEWFKTDNRYYNVTLFATLATLIMSVGAFEFGIHGFWANMWQAAKFGILTSVVIEVYQSMVNKTVALKDSFNDILADIVGVSVGLLIYGLFALIAPVSAIATLTLAIVSTAFMFAEKEHRIAWMAGALCSIIIGLSLFIYA